MISQSEAAPSITRAMGPIVSVVLPAYNAEKTITETLRSVQNQTHCHLEIIVVDDGSTDRTSDIVVREAALDPRIRLLSKPNGGVASARNFGIAAATSELIATIDADDLWHPNKIEKQLALMQAMGTDTGLVYCWSLIIDELGRVTARHKPEAEGEVMAEMCRRNLPGNGSSVLMRKCALVEAGGYDSALWAAGAQGAEDLKLYQAIAADYRFGVVKEYLTAYRRWPNNMSNDMMRMLKSFDIVFADSSERYPDYYVDLCAGRNLIVKNYLLRSLSSWQFGLASRFLVRLLRQDYRFALRQLLSIPFTLLNLALSPKPNADAIQAKWKNMVACRAPKRGGR